MSAFVVPKQTIDLIVQAICRTNDIDMRNALGKQLYDLNERAVAKRYNETPNDHSDYKFESVVADNKEILKAMNLWMYQCSEGEEFMQCRVFQHVKEVSEKLAATIKATKNFWE
jgi:hypothetical protein